MANDEVFLLRELDKFASTTDAMIDRKLSFKNEVIEQGIIEANYYISKKLEVPLATKLFYLCRLRVVEGKPRAIDKIYIDYQSVQGLELENFEHKSFRCILEEKLGFRTIKNQEEIMIVEANAKECELLQIDEGEEILLTRGVTHKDELKPFEYFEISTISSFYRFRSVSNI